MGGIFGTLYSSGCDNGNSPRRTDVPHFQFLDDIARYVNLNELRPILVEENILEDEDLAADLGEAFNEYSRQSDRKEYLKQLFADPGRRDAFHRCIQKSVGRGNHHLGHDYISTLLDVTLPKFADETSIGMSKLLRKRMKGTMEMMVMSITPSVLYGPMVEKKLLTLEEFEKFNSSGCTDIDNNKKILALLKTKGPTAHLLFVQCLFKTQEASPTHGELYDSILKTDDGQDLSIDPNSACPELPLSHLHVPKYLTGKEYHERRSRFETYYHNGDWEALYRESKKCTGSESPETVAIGYLELALGWIFRLNEIEVKKNLELAHGVITSRIKHPAILYARHEYLYALLLRYLKQYPEASKRAEGAMMILTLFEVGEDKAFAQYCYATSFVETLAPNCTNEDFQKAKKLLISAIDYAKEAIDMEILVIYSQLQLARLYLGTTDIYLMVTSDPDRIELAFRCLEELENKLKLNELNMRFESLYYLRKSDYYRCKGEMGLAEETALRAEGVAKRADLPIERKAARTRITYIQQCEFLEDSRPTTGQKHILLEESSTSDLPPLKKNRV